MNRFAALPLEANVALFATAAGVIAVAGWYLAQLADRLADRTGMGEAVAGAVFLGATTSLSGSIASLTAAVDGHAEFAVSNALGGIAAQTAFLAIADLAYRRANLEHAAASLPNIMHGALLVVMLSIILLAVAAPEVTVFGVHPASVALVVTYLIGLRLVRRAHQDPMWKPRSTVQTVADIPDERARREPLTPLLLRFAALAAVVAFSGWVIARAGVALARQSGMSETAVGGVFTAISTSLPELVTTISAVRQGALALAIGDIVGGNVFDTLFVAIADFAYPGSILHAADAGSVLLVISVALLQTGVVLIALIRRQRHGLANVGIDSALMLVLYLGLCALLFTR